jgi:hypothetical protein
MQNDPNTASAAAGASVPAAQAKIDGLTSSINVHSSSQSIGVAEKRSEAV